MIPVHELKSKAEMYAHIKAIKAKIAASEAAHKLELSKAAARRIRAEAEAKAARIQKELEAKREQEEAIRKKIAEMPQISLFTPWLLERCAELGVSHFDILGKKREFAPIRHQLYREAFDRFPLLSYPALGKRFNRDHSSIFYAVHWRRKS